MDKFLDRLADWLRFPILNAPDAGLDEDNALGVGA